MERIRNYLFVLSGVMLLLLAAFSLSQQDGVPGLMAYPGDPYPGAGAMANSGIDICLDDPPPSLLDPAESFKICATPASYTPTPSYTPIPTVLLWSTPTPNNTVATTPYPTTTGTPGTPLPRQGVAPAMGGWSHAVADRHNFASWQFYWSATSANVPGVEHIPLIWGTDLSKFPSNNAIQNIDAATSHNYWLVFNECAHDGQCNTSPYDAAYFLYHTIVYKLYDSAVPGGVVGLDPDAQLIIGGENANPCGMAWLREFVAAYRVVSGGHDVPHAGWHFHIYPSDVPDSWPECDSNTWVSNAARTTVDTAISDMWAILGFLWTYGSPEDEIWITEMGCLGAPCQDETFQFEYVSGVTGWLNSDGRWIDRYAWFSDWTPGFIGCYQNDLGQLIPLFASGGEHPQTMLYALTPIPVIDYDPCEMTPTPVPTPYATPLYSELGLYYRQITPAPPLPKPWPNSIIYLPVVFEGAN